MLLIIFLHVVKKENKANSHVFIWNVPTFMQAMYFWKHKEDTSKLKMNALINV